MLPQIQIFQGLNKNAYLVGFLGYDTDRWPSPDAVASRVLLGQASCEAGEGHSVFAVAQPLSNVKVFVFHQALGTTSLSTRVGHTDQGKIRSLSQFAVDGWRKAQNPALNKLIFAWTLLLFLVPKKGSGGFFALWKIFWVCISAWTLRSHSKCLFHCPKKKKPFHTHASK